jgi:hypothetical protein
MLNSNARAKIRKIRKGDPSTKPFTA